MPASSYLTANHPSMSRMFEIHLLLLLNLTTSTASLCLEIVSMKITSRTGDDGQPWPSPTLTHVKKLDYDFSSVIEEHPF